MHSNIGSLDTVSMVSSLMTQSRPSAVRVALLKSTPPGTEVGTACCLAAFVITERREFIEDISVADVDGLDITSMSAGRREDISSNENGDTMIGSSEDRTFSFGSILFSEFVCGNSNSRKTLGSSALIGFKLGRTSRVAWELKDEEMGSEERDGLNNNSSTAEGKWNC